VLENLQSFSYNWPNSKEGKEMKKMQGSQDQSTTSTIVIGIRSNLAIYLRWRIELSHVGEIRIF
jgi:hypothetical protein